MQLKVPHAWQEPAFFSTAGADEVAVVLEAAARLIPWSTKLVCAHQDANEEVRRQGVEDAVSAALAHVQNEAVADAVRAKHHAEAQTNEFRSQLDDARIKMAELQQAHKAAEGRLAEAEERGRAAAIVSAADRAREEVRCEDTQRAKLETELRSRATEALTERDGLRARVEELEATRLALVQENAQLKTPSGRGKTGEADVNEICASLGFRVFDTSQGRFKDNYGDLLVQADADDAESPGSDNDSDGSVPRGGVRIAIEIKNRGKVSASDVARFEDKVRVGVAAGRFEGGMFISLRCPIAGQTSSAWQKLVDDARGNPTVPMAYLGAERGLPPVPVAASSIEIMLQSHVGLSQQVAHIRLSDASQEMDDADLKRVQQHFAEMATYTSEMFAEFGRHQGLIESARKSLDAMRQRCILLYRTARRTNAAVPWLQRSMPPLGFERGLDSAVRLAAEGKLVWNNVAGKETLLGTFGKDSATATALEELARVSKESKVADLAREEKKRAREDPQSS